MNDGTHIGRYRILRLLREGGQGSVYLGFDEQLQRQVAVKLYTLPRERKARREVLNEARTIASIDNARIVKIYDVISAGDHLALIMAYVPGCDLEELLQQRPQGLSLTELLNLAIDVAGALAAVRQQGLVHGDLKASNVLVAEDGSAILTDFGISRAVTAAAGSDRDAGSLSALSPEQVSGERLDVRSDLFALGCLLYRLVSGRHPFLLDGQLSRRRLLEDDPEPLPARLGDGSAVPDQLRDLIARLLQKSPAARPDNTHRVRQILRDLVRRQVQPIASLPLEGVRSSLRGQPDRELPPVIPQAFQGRLQTRMEGELTWSELEWRDVWAFLQRRRVQQALVVALLLSALLGWALLPRSQPVALQISHVWTGGAEGLPDELGREWLRGQVCTAALRHESRLLFFDAPKGCPDVADEYPVNRPQPAVQETFSVALQCEGNVCVLSITRGITRGVTRSQTRSLTRSQGDERLYRQTVILAGMPLAQWRAAIAHLVDELYRSSSAS